MASVPMTLLATFSPPAPTLSVQSSINLPSDEEFVVVDNYQDYLKENINQINNNTNCQTFPNTQSKVSSSDISIAHRLKQRQPSNRPPSIIVRFTSKKVRDQVYRARRSLKNSHPPVYINENLTKMTASLYRQARELVKKKVLHAALISGGALFIRKSEEASCKSQKISTESALRDA